MSLWRNKNEEIENEMSFEEIGEEGEGGFVIRVTEFSSRSTPYYSLPTYFITITTTLLSQINNKLKFKFNSEKALFEALKSNYIARNNIPTPPISFTCSFYSFL